MLGGSIASMALVNVMNVSEPAIYSRLLPGFCHGCISNLYTAIHIRTSVAWILVVKCSGEEDSWVFHGYVWPWPLRVLADCHCEPLSLQVGCRCSSVIDFCHRKCGSSFEHSTQGQELGIILNLSRQLRMTYKFEAARRIFEIKTSTIPQQWQQLGKTSSLKFEDWRRVQYWSHGF